MDRLRAAMPLARLLVSLAERRRSVVVRVVSRARVAELVLVEGRAVELAGVDSELLGDALLRAGSLDPSRHGAALHAEAPRGRVGEWLLAQGMVTQGALRAALDTQLRERLATLLGWPACQVSVRAGRDGEAQGVEVLDAVFAGLMHIATQMPRATLRSLAGQRALVATTSGTSELERLTQSDLRTLLCADPSENLCCTRAVIRVLGLVKESHHSPEAYGLLLRKRREIKRRAPAAALLDLCGEVTPESARRAFRKLAARLHPDRFEREHPELRALCSDVMCALVAAESELRRTRKSA